MPFVVGKISNGEKIMHVTFWSILMLLELRG